MSNTSLKGNGILRESMRSPQEANNMVTSLLLRNRSIMQHRVSKTRGTIWSHLMMTIRNLEQLIMDNIPLLLMNSLARRPNINLSNMLTSKRLHTSTSINSPNKSHPRLQCMTGMLRGRPIVIEK
jgi:type III secretory pathway lipoprotein EscJ